MRRNILCLFAKRAVKGHVLMREWKNFFNEFLSSYLVWSFYAISPPAYTHTHTTISSTPMILPLCIHFSILKLYIQVRQKVGLHLTRPLTWAPNSYLFFRYFKMKCVQYWVHCLSVPGNAYLTLTSFYEWHAHECSLTPAKILSH